MDQIEEVLKLKTHFTKKEAACFIGSTERFLYQQEKPKGTLDRFKISGKTYYRRDQVEALFQKVEK